MYMVCVKLCHVYKSIGEWISIDILIDLRWTFHWHLSHYSTNMPSMDILIDSWSTVNWFLQTHHWVAIEMIQLTLTSNYRPTDNWVSIELPINCQFSVDQVHCIDQDVDQDVNRVPIKVIDWHWTADAFHIQSCTWYQLWTNVHDQSSHCFLHDKQSSYLLHNT